MFGSKKKDKEQEKLKKKQAEETLIGIIKENPHLYNNIIEPSVELMRAVLSHKDGLKYVDVDVTVSNSYWLTFAVSHHADAIRYVPRPSPDLQMIAVKRDPFSVKYITNPCKEVMDYLEKIDGGTRKFIKNVEIRGDEEYRLSFLRRYPELFRNIYNPSPAVIAEAVELLPSNIQYVSHQTEKLQIAAIKKNPRVIQLIKNPTSEAVELSIRLDPTVIELLDYINYEHFKIAVEMLPRLIRVVPEMQSRELQMLAVKDDPNNLKYIKEVHSDVKWWIVENHPEYKVFFYSTTYYQLINSCI